MTSALNEKWWQVRYRFRFFYSEVNNIDEVYKYMLKVKFYFLILTTSRFMDTSTTDGSRWWFLKALFATTGESLDSRRQLKACSQYFVQHFLSTMTAPVHSAGLLTEEKAVRRLLPFAVPPLLLLAAACIVNVSARNLQRVGGRDFQCFQISLSSGDCRATGG